jgi:hypothetical protein
MTAPALSALDPATRRRLVRRALTRAALSVAMPVLLYYLLPMDQTLGGAPILLLAVGLLAFAAFAAWQIRTILRSAYPALQATEAVALTISLFLILFATTYFLMARSQSGMFDENLSRTDALYFTVTVFATVGFGDIVPTSEAARVAVMIQMLADLIVLGLLIRTILRAIDASRQRKTTATGTPGSQNPQDHPHET